MACANSEILGNHVPQRTVKHASTNSRLLNRKLDSRETTTRAVLAAQVRLVHQEEIEERSEGDDQEPSEPFTYRRLREGVDGADDPLRVRNVRGWQART